jgi:hypothetical protein
MSAIYTEDTLKQMKGQAVKDIWHAMIGKPKGIKNTTGLKNADEIIQAILEGQRNPEFLEGYKGSKQISSRKPVEMPAKTGEKKKPGPKPKEKSVTVATQPEQKQFHLQAYESLENPIRPSEIQRISVKKLFVNDTMYFLDSKTNTLYNVVDGKPGLPCAKWNPHEKRVQEL